MWRSIIINETQIEYFSEKYVLVKIPKKDYKFWHPSKCVSVYGKSYKLSYTREWEFRIFKKDSSNYKKICVDTFEEYFENQLYHQNKIEAEKFEVGEITVEEDLIDS